MHAEPATCEKMIKDALDSLEIAYAALIGLHSIPEIQKILEAIDKEWERCERELKDTLS
jgi:hypothetical protein